MKGILLTSGFYIGVVVLISFFILYIFIGYDKLINIRSILKGITGGFLLAFVCFYMLPETFFEKYYFNCVFCMIFGILLIILIDNIYQKNQIIKILLLFFYGLLLSMVFVASINKSILITIISMIYIFLSTFLNRGKRSFILMILAILIISIGTMAGILIYISYDLLCAIIYSFTGGILLYQLCQDIIPQKIEYKTEILSSLGAILGFIIGVILL